MSVAVPLSALLTTPQRDLLLSFSSSPHGSASSLASGLSLEVISPTHNIADMVPWLFCHSRLRSVMEAPTWSRYSSTWSRWWPCVSWVLRTHCHGGVMDTITQFTKHAASGRHTSSLYLRQPFSSSNLVKTQHSAVLKALSPVSCCKPEAHSHLQMPPDTSRCSGLSLNHRFYLSKICSLCSLPNSSVDIQRWHSALRPSRGFRTGRTSSESLPKAWRLLPGKRHVRFTQADEKASTFD